MLILKRLHAPPACLTGVLFFLFLRCRCLLYQLCFHRQAFEDGAKLSIINGNFVIPETDVTHVMFHDLIRQTLAVDPEFRNTIQQT